MTSATSTIAVVVGADSVARQALFAATVAAWRAAGVKVAGVIAEPERRPGGPCSAGILRNIVSGQPVSIYLDAAPSNTVCHLDTAGVGTACAEILDQIQTSDLVVLSKFGKLEAQQAGLTAAFEQAIAAGKPLLTTVSDKHREAWQAFAPGAVYLPVDAAALRDWWSALEARAT